MVNGQFTTNCKGDSHACSSKTANITLVGLQGTMPGARWRGRPCTAWIDNINTWTGLSVEESIRMTEDRDKWSKVRPWCDQP